jgi:hypothetical protein
VKNWICFLVLASFIRLQFLCCCGPIGHALENESPRNLQAACAPAKIETGCHKCCQHAVDAEPAGQNPSSQSPFGETAEQIEADTVCTCQLCNPDDPHQPHLYAAQHLRITSSPKFGVDSLVVNQSHPVTLAAGSLAEEGQLSAAREVSPSHCVSILCQFGHLRI